ncbi:hypothetical protein [Paenibacillus nasutitermitis]|uniref:Uncharacterized protein n=1 Tax=Paenibacillus nasutitermitis TaxID=1652958 RepID=A0A916YX86_9BACL|nr:hypothetical protein [Paenibacillus nasutitermitis]GGD65570.1 hypothetical protein GCM10010911_24200 [Paenibacillus nasutitermitis]
MKLKWKISLFTALIVGTTAVTANFHVPRAEASSYSFSFVSSFFDVIQKFQENAEKKAGAVVQLPIPSKNPNKPENPGNSQGNNPNKPENPGNSHGNNPNKPENPGNSQGNNPNKPENPGNSHGNNPNKPENPGNSHGNNPNKPENPGNGKPKPETPKVDEKAVKLVLKQTEEKLIQLKNSTQNTLMSLAFQFAFAETTHEKTVLYQKGKDALAASIASFAVIMKDAAAKLAALGADVSQLEVYNTAFDTFQVQGKEILKQIVD